MSQHYSFEVLSELDPAVWVPVQGTLSQAIDLAHRHAVHLRLQDVDGFDRFEVRTDGSWRVM